MSLFTVTFDSSDDGKNRLKSQGRTNKAKPQKKLSPKKYFNESSETDSDTGIPMARQNPKIMAPKMKASVRLNEKIYSTIPRKSNKKSMIVFSSSDSSDSSRGKIENVEATYSLTTINSDESSDDIPFINENKEKAEVNFNPKPPAKKSPILRPFPKHHSPNGEETDSPSPKHSKSFESKGQITENKSDDILKSNIADHQEKEEEENVQENQENVNDNVCQKDESNTDSQKSSQQPDSQSPSVKSEQSTNDEEPNSARNIQIPASDDNNEENEKLDKKDKKLFKKEKKSKKDKKKKKPKKSDSNKKSKNEKSTDQISYEKGEFENGVTDPAEVERLRPFMHRLSGHEVPKDLIPYKMDSISKITFHGKKTKFILSRGDTPILYAKLKNKSGSEFVAISSSPEKGAYSLAQVLTGSSFSSFSLRRGGQFGGELMNIRYTVPQVDYAPRNIELYFFVPPEGIPNSLTSRKPRFTMGSTWILDIKGRIAQRSIKNCVLVDENNREIMSVMKVKGAEISIEANPAIGELCVFAVGISSVLCKI